MGRFGGKGNNSRLLMPGEIDLIRKAFQHAALPSLMTTVTIADGVNGNGGAWTDSDYQINVGPSLFKQDLSIADPSTLIHEMTHVWRYFNGTLTKAHATAAQGLYGFARRSDYLYDYDLGDSWNDMGFEGQAQLVEDWYTNDKLRMKGSRYNYVRAVLQMRDVEARGMTLVEIERSFEEKVERADDPTGPYTQLTFSAHDSIPALTDSKLLEILQIRYAANDVRGYGGRVKTLESLFGSTNQAEAITLFVRLTSNFATDKVAVYFHDHMNEAASTRNNLLKILKARLSER